MYIFSILTEQMKNFGGGGRGLLRLFWKGSNSSYRKGNNSPYRRVTQRLVVILEIEKPVKQS